MNRRKIVCLGMLALLPVLAAGCKQTEAVETEDVYGQAYVSENGKMLNSIVYETQRDVSDLKLEKGDVTVLVETGDKEEKANVTDIKAEKGRITVFIKEMPVADMENLRVESKQEGLQADGIAIRTKTADDFVKKSYVSSEGVEITYWLYQPENAKNLPLMVWEHGGGEVQSESSEGANVWANRGAVTWIEEGDDTLVLTVQYPQNYSFGIADKPEELEKMQQYNTAKYEVIRQLIEEGTVNPDRVYISGASSGGGGAIRFMMQYPDLFAGALVLSAKDVLAPISEQYGLAYQMDQSKLTIPQEEYEKCYRKSEEMLEDIDLTGTPIWFVHAEKDFICTSYTSKIMYDILQEKGAEKNKLTLWTEEECKEMGLSVNHFAYNKALENERMIQWIYEQNRMDSLEENSVNQKNGTGVLSDHK